MNLLYNERTASCRGHKRSSRGWNAVLVCAHHHLLWRLASLVLGCWKHARFSLGTLDHLAAHVVPSRHWALLVAPRRHGPWLDDGTLGRRWWTSPVCHIARCRWLLRQRACRLGGAPMRNADELSDPLEPLLVEVTDRAVAKELPRHEQSGLRVHRAVTRMGGRSCWSQ